MVDQKICAVHQILDGDSTIKKCMWCYTCKQWICMEDWVNKTRRALAAAKLHNPIRLRKVTFTLSPAPTNNKPETKKGCGCRKSS